MYEDKILIKPFVCSTEFIVNRNYIIQFGASERRLTFTINSHNNIKILRANIENINLFYSYYVSSDAYCEFRYFILSCDIPFVLGQ